MKLYEKKDQCGRTVEWWTQRNKNGNYFSIFPCSAKGTFAVVVNKEDASRAVYAVTTDFATAEKKLREAAKKYRQAEMEGIMEFIVYIDKENTEAQHLVTGLEAAKLCAEQAVKDGALYSAVIDKDGNTVAEYGG